MIEAYAQLAIFCFLVGLMVYRRNVELLGANTERDAEKQKADFMSAIVEDSRDGIVVQDVRAHILWANSSWLELFGYELDEVIGKNPISFVIPERERPSTEEIDAFTFDLESGVLDDYEVVRNVRKDGSELWTSLSFAHHVLDNGEERIVVFCRDVTEDVEQEEQLKKTNEMVAFRADHDALTAVSNREKLRRVFGEVRAAALDDGTRFGLLHIDLDFFKSINDTFGHAAGDSVIVKTADRMRMLVQSSDLLARTGGDEFVILCADVSGFEELQTLAAKIIDAVSTPIHWEDRILQIGASVGASISSDEVNDYTVMMQNADTALYEAKKKGRGQVACFDTEMDRSHLDQTRLASELAEALKQGQLEVHLQPQYSLIARSVTGFEALVRWKHPTRGLLLPKDFLEVAGDVGAIEEIDRFVASTSFAALKSLHQKGFEGLHISLNASPQSMANTNYLEFLKWEIEKEGLEPNQVTIEVLETTFFSHKDAKPEKLIRAMSEAGFRVELDDFGTGYAGLSQLGRLRVDGVKIDKSMIEGLEDDITNQIIVQAMISLSSDLGLRVVAEGIRTNEDATLLREFGCVNIQGDAISEALPINEIAAYLTTTDFTELFRKVATHGGSHLARVS